MRNQRHIAVQMDLDQAYKRHASIFAGIHNFARQQGQWRLIIDEWADFTLPARPGMHVPYDGLIGRITAQGARRAKLLGLPVVNVWYNSPAENLPGVFSDFAESGRLRAEHLLMRGFQNFGAVYRQSYRSTVVEATGFERAIRAAGCTNFQSVSVEGPADSFDHRITSHHDWMKNMRRVERWLNTLTLPVGLYVYEIFFARVIIEMCLNRGWRVPEDVAIVAGGNEENNCERPEPSLTSVELPYEQVGFEAARLLDKLINEKDNSQPEPETAETILLPPVGIVARTSTDFFAVNDSVIRRVLRIIDENLHRQLTIDNLAEAVNVSRRTLTGLFRNKLNRSVADEIQRLRIERVKRELIATEVSIQTISRMAGFSSARTLNDAFRREVGCSPRQYRKQRLLAKSSPQISEIESP